MSDKTVELNDRHYRWPSQPIVVVTIDGGDPAYMDYGFSNGLIPNIERFKKDGLTRGSLNYWAKLDNEETYYEIIERNLKRKIEDCISKGGSHDDIAEVVHGRWKDKFICVDLNKKKWARFAATPEKSLTTTVHLNSIMNRRVNPLRLSFTHPLARLKHRDKSKQNSPDQLV